IDRDHQVKLLNDRSRIGKIGAQLDDPADLRTRFQGRQVLGPDHLLQALKIDARDIHQLEKLSRRNRPAMIAQQAGITRPHQPHAETTAPRQAKMSLQPTSRRRKIRDRVRYRVQPRVKDLGQPGRMTVEVRRKPRRQRRDDLREGRGSREQPSERGERAVDDPGGPSPVQKREVAEELYCVTVPLLVLYQDGSTMKVLARPELA